MLGGGEEKWRGGDEKKGRGERWKGTTFVPWCGSRKKGKLR
jgi:hypothetical protein